jgi:hypothetical protein
LVCLASLLTAGSVAAADSDKCEVFVRQHNGDLVITAALIPEDKFTEDLKNGLTKELVIYLDLFRVWKLWPNEFILGRKITRTLKSDPIKREYVVITSEGNNYSEKRFRDFESMLAWAMHVTNMRLSSAKPLEGEAYFVRATYESVVTKYSPFISWVPLVSSGKEFSVAGDSARFSFTPAAVKQQ